MCKTRLILGIAGGLAAALLAVAGCRPSWSGPPAGMGAPRAEAVLPVPGPLPAPGSAVVQKGTVTVVVQWPKKSYPGFSAQTIPLSTDKIEIQVKRAGDLMESAVLTAPFPTPTPVPTPSDWCCLPGPTISPPSQAGGPVVPGQTTIETFVLDAGDYDFSALAYRGAEKIAQGNVLVTVVGGADVPASLTLGPLFAPTISALSAQGAGSGASFKVYGTNFGSGDSVPIWVSIGSRTVAVVRNSETELTVTTPEGDPNCFYCNPWDTGPLAIISDGVEMSTEPPIFYHVTALGLSDQAKAELEFRPSPPPTLFIRPGAARSIESFGIYGLAPRYATPDPGPSGSTPVPQPTASSFDMATMSIALTVEAEGAVSLEGGLLIADSNESTGSVVFRSGDVWLNLGASCYWCSPSPLPAMVSLWQPAARLPVPTPAPSSSTWWPAYINRVYFVDDTTGWAVGNRGAIFKTSNGGAAWEAQKSGTAVDLKAVYFSDGNNGMIGGAKAVILRTSDGGATWTGGQSTLEAQTSQITDLIQLDTSTGAINYAMADGSLYSSTDGGAAWQYVSYGGDMGNPLISSFVARSGFFQARVSNLLVATGDPQTLTTIPRPSASGSPPPDTVYPMYAITEKIALGSGTYQYQDPETLDTTNVDALYKTSDGGTTWVRLVSSPPTNLFGWVFFGDESNGWTIPYNRCCDAQRFKYGFHRTTDGGMSWTREPLSPQSFFFRNADLGWAVEGNAVFKFTR